MTVVFHNSHNSVWNAIQEAMSSAGFVVADVRTLDKQQSSYRQATALTAVKQDLVISAYRPNIDLEERFKIALGSENLRGNSIVSLASSSRLCPRKPNGDGG